MTIMHPTAQAARDLRARGWQPVRLHGLRPDGGCTCRLGTACKVAGKHPTDKDWQSASMPTDGKIAAAWSGWRACSNVGALTGKPSGLFVLDVDPEHGGHDTLAALVAEHGPLPTTYTVRTGSGGLHHHFALPEFPVGNSAGRLGVGLDVRGNRGQVVAPPSVSAKGAYTVKVDAPVAEAPGWLLDLLRKPAAAPASRASARRPTRASTRRRVEALVQTVLDASEGTRNARLYWATCRMVEVIAAGGLTADEAQHCLHLAGEAAGLTGDEVAATVASGLRTAGAA